MLLSYPVSLQNVFSPNKRLWREIKYMYFLSLNKPMKSAHILHRQYLNITMPFV